MIILFINRWLFKLNQEVLPENCFYVLRKKEAMIIFKRFGSQLNRFSFLVPFWQFIPAVDFVSSDGFVLVQRRIVGSNVAWTIFHSH